LILWRRFWRFRCRFEFGAKALVFGGQRRDLLRLLDDCSQDSLEGGVDDVTSNG
jgi:hypothetical protein